MASCAFAGMCDASTCSHLAACDMPKTAIEMDRVFKALADSRRRKLPDRLHADNGKTLSELCEGAGMARQSLTKHPAVLEKAEPVVTTWRWGDSLA
jgi:hypothetical protein